MLKTIKNLSFMMLLGLGLQTVSAMDDMTDTKEDSSLPSTYRSSKEATNELLNQDPIKDFVYQVKRQARNKFEGHGCPSCSTYKTESKELWTKIRNADTSTEEVKATIQQFVDKASLVLAPEMKVWSQKLGFTVLETQENPSFGDLPFSLMALLLSGLMDTSMDDNTEITIIIPLNSNNNGNR